MLASLSRHGSRFALAVNPSGDSKHSPSDLDRDATSIPHRCKMGWRAGGAALFVLAVTFVIGGGLSILLFYESGTGIEVYEAYWLLCWFGIVLFVYLVLGTPEQARHEFNTGEEYDEHSERDSFFAGDAEYYEPDVSVSHKITLPAPASRRGSRSRSRSRSHSDSDGASGRTTPAAEELEPTHSEAHMEMCGVDDAPAAVVEDSKEAPNNVGDVAVTVEHTAPSLLLKVEPPEAQHTQVLDGPELFSARAVIKQYTKTDYKALMHEPHPVSPWVVWTPYIVIQLVATTTPLIPCIFRAANGRPFAGENAVGRFIVAWNIIVSPLSIHAFLFWSPSKVLAKLRGLQLMANHAGWTVRHIRSIEDLERWNCLMWDLRKHAQDKIRSNNRQFLSVIVSSFLLSLVLIVLFFFTPQDSLQDPLWIQLFELGLVVSLLALVILWKAADVLASFDDAARRLVVMGVKHGSREEHFANTPYFQRISQYWLTTDTVLNLRIFGVDVSFGNKFRYLLALLASNCLLFVLKSVVIPFIRDYSAIDL